MVTSPDDRDVMLSVAGQDLVAAWLNGERLVSNRLMENTFYGFEQFPLKLRGGLNRLLLKVSHNGEWTRTLGWIAGIQFPARSNLESSTDVSDAPACPPRSAGNLGTTERRPFDRPGDVPRAD